MSGHVALVCLCVLFVWSASSTVLREDGDHQPSTEAEGQTLTKMEEEHSRAQLDARKEGEDDEIRRVFSDQLTTCNSRLYEAQEKILSSSERHHIEAESLRAENLQLKQHLERLEKTKAQCDLEVTALTGDVAKLRGKEEELNEKLLANKASDLQQELFDKILNSTKTILQSACTKLEQDFIKLDSNIKETVDQSTSDSKQLIQNTNDIKQEISEVVKQSENILVEIISSRTEMENSFVKMTDETNSNFTALQKQHQEMIEAITTGKKEENNTVTKAGGLFFLNGTLYYFSNQEQMIYHAARDFCIAKGFTLVAIESDEEQQRVFNHKQHLGMLDSWLGGSDEAQKDTWRWIGTGENLTYTNWGIYEPSRGSGENCMEMRSDGVWHDYICNIEQPFICEQQG